MAAFSEDARDRARTVRLLLLDVDGVLTDGTVYLDDNGVEGKGFNIMDGLGLNLLRRNGIQVGIITGRDSNVVRVRAGELGIEHLVQGCKDKLAAATELAASLGLDLSQVAFAGDDLIDLRLLSHVGLALSVPNGAPEVRNLAHHVSAVPGGRGAVREMCELILGAQDKWNAAVEGYR